MFWLWIAFYNHIEWSCMSSCSLHVKMKRKPLFTNVQGKLFENSQHLLFLLLHLVQRWFARRSNITDCRSLVQMSYQMFECLSFFMYLTIMKVVSWDKCISYGAFMNDPLPFNSTLSFLFIAHSVQMPLVMNVEWSGVMRGQKRLYCNIKK